MARLVRSFGQTILPVTAKPLVRSQIPAAFSLSSVFVIELLLKVLVERC